MFIDDNLSSSTNKSKLLIHMTFNDIKCNFMLIDDCWIHQFYNFPRNWLTSPVSPQEPTHRPGLVRAFPACLRLCGAALSQSGGGGRTIWLQFLLENWRKIMFVDCWSISTEFPVHFYFYPFHEGNSWTGMDLLPNFLAICGHFDPNGWDMVLVTSNFYLDIKYRSPKILKTLRAMDSSSGLGEAIQLLPISESAVQPGRPEPFWWILQEMMIIKYHWCRPHFSQTIFLPPKKYQDSDLIDRSLSRWI